VKLTERFLYFRNLECLLRDILSIDQDGMMIHESSITTETRRDMAERMFEAFAGDGLIGAFASKHSKWAAVLKAAIQHTSHEAVTKEQWIGSIAGALLSLGVEWMPGSHRGKITYRRVVKLVGSVTAHHQIMLTARPGSPKRRAQEAIAEYKAHQAASSKKAKRRRIDFGCEIPFRDVPEFIRAGFNEQRVKGNRLSELALSHYQQALFCLEGCLDDRRCDVLLMLVLTLSASSVTPDVKEGDHHFSVAKKPISRGMFAANLVTRMLWFLKPEAFPIKEDEGQVLRVPRMIERMGE
jgi:hypothetical protein